MIKIDGIDVSNYQGNIDWAKVKASGKKFAIIKLGYAGYDGAIDINSKFKVNIEGALKAGIDVGVYVYAYTKTPAAARRAAQETLKLVKPYKLTYPICFDVEETKLNCLISQGRAGLSATISAFLDEIEKAKYYGMLYTYTSFAQSYLDMTKLAKYDLWIADYREPTGTKCPYTGSFGIWQYRGGSNGRCEGISTPCDLNIAYKDYPTIIRNAKLNNLVDSPVVEKPIEKPKDNKENLEDVNALKSEIAEFGKQVASLIKANDTLIATNKEQSNQIKVLQDVIDKQKNKVNQAVEILSK